MQIERKLEELGLVLPPLLRRPGGMRLPFQSVRIRGDRARLVN